MAATAAAAATVHQPNFFELSGGDIKTSYSSTSFGGKPMFHYEDGKVKKDFTGDQVRSDVIHGSPGRRYSARRTPTRCVLSRERDASE